MPVTIIPYQFAVNNVGDREEIRVVNRCSFVEIKELPSITPKQLYRISNVVSGGVAAEVNAGTPFFFDPGTYGYPYFLPGTILGYIESATGATTFQRIESVMEP